MRENFLHFIVFMKIAKSLQKILPANSFLYPSKFYQTNTFNKHEKRKIYHKKIILGLLQKKKWV